jgi:hypothetical protein
MTVKKSADAIRDVFAEIFKRAEVSPNFLVADNGTEFKASFDAFCKAEGIKVLIPVKQYCGKEEQRSEKENSCVYDEEPKPPLDAAFGRRGESP